MVDNKRPKGDGSAARVVTVAPGVYEMWCDEHSTAANPKTGFAPQAALTPDLANAQKRVDSHNAKWHAAPQGGE